MYTQCPVCRKSYEISKEKLLENNVFTCVGCSSEFNAFDFLSDTLPETKSRAHIGGRNNSGNKSKPRLKKQPKRRQQSKKTSVTEKKNTKPPKDSVKQVVETRFTESLPWEIEQAPVTAHWFVGFVLGCLGLVGQVLFFEAKGLSQNPDYRPKLEVLAKWFDYTLPTYQNIDELQVLEGSLNTMEDGHLRFNVVVINQAAFEQKIPDIKLALLDNDGQLFAERIFTPKDYLPYKNRTQFLIAPDETVQASLHIAKPKTPIGGYHFDIIYGIQ